MDPIVDVFAANFEACRWYVKDRVGRFSVTLYKAPGGKIKTVIYEQEALKLNVEEHGSFDKIVIDTHDGEELENKMGFTLETVMEKVTAVQKFDCLDVYMYNKDEQCIDVKSFDFDEVIEVDVSHDVAYVIVKLGYMESCDEEEEGERVDE